MIRIFINDYVVTVPIPAIAIGEVGSGHSEIEVAKVKAVRSATGQVPNVTGAKAAVEVAVFPGMIQMIAGIVLAGIVTNPLVAVHVGSIGMPRMLFVEVLRSTLGGSGARIASRRRSTGGSLARRKVALLSSFVPVFLGKTSHRNRSR
jgi:hypothetical protein